ncbi:von Willebrand factor type A [Planctomycetales bacterium 10988]|nr:von Willebrand factor type A [Planctomycetales bacterium 10988]
MDWELGHSERFLWLLGILLALGCMAWAAVARRRAWRRYATPEMRTRLQRQSGTQRRLWPSLLQLVVLGLLVLAAVDPRLGRISREVPQQGREVMFVLDVSRSMLAEDLRPNRLDNAKRQIRGMLTEMKGDRAGLLIFAGEAEQKVPLTRNYRDFRQELDQLGPENLSQGGSNLNKALLMAGNAFLDQTAGHKAVVLLTDGEDHTLDLGDPISTAEQLYEERGIRIYAIGLGDASEGARIPLRSDEKNVWNQEEEYLRFDNQVVYSRRRDTTLQKIALISGGAYLPSSTGSINAGRFYRQYIASLESRVFDAATIESYIPRFQWFLAPAILLLCWEMLLPQVTRRSTIPFEPTFAGESESKDPAGTVPASEIV